MNDKTERTEEGRENFSLRSKLDTHERKKLKEYKERRGSEESLNHGCPF